MAHIEQKMNSKLARVRGMGSAKDGTHHWWMQRLTALALIILSVWFIGSIMGLIGADRGQIIYWLQQPWCIIMMALFVISGLYHGTIGMQVVVEDYVHHPARKFILIAGMQMLMVFSIAVAVYALCKIAFLPY